MREEILYKESKTGTTIVYFDTSLQAGEGKSPAYMTFDNLNRPYEITTFDGEQQWLNKGIENSGVDPSAIGVGTITGTVYTNTVDYLLSTSQKSRARRDFALEMHNLFSGHSQSYIFFREQLVDDLFVTIGLERTEKVIDTLSIYNNLRNSFPTQESDTGTVFGRLIAIQKVKDESDNNIKIPLNNVPIGIFASSDVFSDATDVDDNGSRISLNLKEASVSSDYFNAESFSADTQQFLQEGSNFTQVPSHYKFMTYTNEEGEFVIHNVPTGTQTMVFEVDMFKQGLTKDEISLNFFPFPADNQPNIDTVPSFFFRQFPIDVVPTWGDFQTGYTEVNIISNLDLRKWSTFFVPPVAIDKNTIEDLQSQGIPYPIQVQIRDMATEGFPIRDIEMVEVPDIRDREANQQFMWKNEFKQLKSRFEIRRNGWQAFKLPANCYDPRGFRTDREGIPTGDRGVWLAAYQMKLFYDSPSSFYRATGQRALLIEDNSFSRRDHFHLNFPYENFNEVGDSALAEGASIGVFPYEKAWSHNYPEPYGIPKLPTQSNPDYYDNMGDNGEYVLEHPLYTDGDRIGHPYTQEFRDNGFGGGTGGYGIEYDSGARESYKTDFSRLVTKNIMYRYENRGNRSEEYANGFKPNIPTFPAQPGVSSVVNGEKYQRTECGYGYFLKPEGWARTAVYPWWGISESTFAKDLGEPNGLVTPEEGSVGGTLSKAAHFNSMTLISSNTGQKTYLNIGSNANGYIKTGYLDLYRIVNSNPNENLNPIQLGENTTTVKFHFGPTRVQGAHTAGSRKPQFKQMNDDAPNQDEWRYSDNDDVNQQTVTGAKLYVQNLGIKRAKIKFGNGSELSLAAGQGVELSLFEIADDWSHVTCEAEGNSDYNYELRYYTKCIYKFEFRNVRFYKNLTSGGQQKLRKTNSYQIITRSLNSPLPGEGYKKLYLHSISRDVKTRSNIFGNQKCNGGYYQNPATIRYRGSFWDGAKNKRHIISYWTSYLPYPYTCDGDSGYQIVGGLTVQGVFDLSISGDFVGTLSGLSNLLDDIF